MNRENEIHTRPQALLFLAKVSLFQLKRTAENFFDSEIKTFHSGVENIEAIVSIEAGDAEQLRAEIKKSGDF